MGEWKNLVDLKYTELDLVSEKVDSSDTDRTSIGKFWRLVYMMIRADAKTSPPYRLGMRTYDV
jgi:hypothetical protein